MNEKKYSSHPKIYVDEEDLEMAKRLEAHERGISILGRM